MDPRKISVKLRRDPRETAERHSQANPLTLECTLASGETVTEAMDLRAELHAAQTPATTPLATTATVVMASGSAGPWELEFSGAQMNQTVLPDSAEDFWLVIYATNAADDLFTLGKIALTLTFDNVSQATPAPPEPPLYATYAFRTIAVAGQSSVVAETTADTLTLVAGSNITLTTNAATDTITIAASGGGGGSTDLTMTRTANAVTITPSGGGAAATIPQASDTAAGVLTAAHHAQIAALGTMSTQAAAAVAITGGSITGTTVSGVTLSGSSTPTLAVSGTTSVSGTNTGDQTISLTGDVTGSGAGSFAATIAANAVTAGKIASNAVTTSKLDAEAVTYAKIQPLAAASTLLGRGTAGTTAVREIGIGAGLTMSGDTLSASGTGDVTGPASSTANAVARFSLTGGKTLLNSAIVIDDETASTQQNVAIRNVDPATNSAIVITPKGTGAFILGPKPDGGTTGGNARGVNAVDFQRVRNSQSQVASGEGSGILCGAQNTSSNFYSSVIGGSGNMTSANSSCAGGQTCTASGTASFAFGLQSQATASQAVALGNRAIANRIGMQAHANGQIATTGDAQRGAVVMRRQTTDATPVPLSMDGAAPTGSTITTSTHFILLNNQAVFADIRVVARSASGADHAAFMRRVLIKRDANAASTAIVGTVLYPTADIESAGASAWEVAITADTTNGGMLITVTGAASTTINWVASVEFVETIRA